VGNHAYSWLIILPKLFCRSESDKRFVGWNLCLGLSVVDPGSILSLGSFERSGIWKNSGPESHHWNRWWVWSVKSSFDFDVFYCARFRCCAVRRLPGSNLPLKILFIWEPLPWAGCLKLITSRVSTRMPDFTKIHLELLLVFRVILQTLRQTDKYTNTDRSKTQSLTMKLWGVLGHSVITVHCVV